MDEYRENVKKVQKALNQDAAIIQPNPYLAQRVLNAANAESYGKGGIVVKRKMPIALIIAAVLMLSGIVAVAATLLWQDYVPQMTQTEHEMGDYVEWPATRRIQLAKDIVVMGYLDESEDTQILFSETATEQDKAAAADRLMLKLTGLADLKEVHSTLITYAIMGHEDTWTPEQRVWWNGIVTMYGDDGATDTLIVPTKDVLSEEDAIRIARAALQEAYGFDEVYMSSLHPVANLYTTDERPDYKRWDIQFKKYREGSSTYVEKVYCAIVDENGEVISDPDVGVPHPAESVARATEILAEQKMMEDPEIVKVYKKYADKVGSPCFWHWTYEEKAAYSMEIQPLVQQAIDTGWLRPFSDPNASLYDQYISLSTERKYGLPVEGDITEEAAMETAMVALNEKLTYDVDKIKYIYTSFDVTNPSQHLWRFMFYPNNKNVPLGSEIPFALVEIDAATGNVITCITFERSEITTDYEYAIKWY